jgi:transcriptional regulator with PAS, ATPase and Fis domain
MSNRNHNVVSIRRENGITIVGKSPAMTRVVDLIDKFASADSTVLIIGPTGTGKELVAKSIHSLSARWKGPFVPVNCAALPSPLIEGELFGWTKGSFTGALADRVGPFETAKGGTIFLDEIGDMSLTAQAKLLRPLQERSIRRLGENIDRPIDCRVIAATNKDLEAACKAGTFREDLYYRLAVAPIYLPSLSKRIEDIPTLVDHFLEKITLWKLEGGRSVPRISDEAMDAIMSYPFPGNVRELENLIEKAILLSDQEVIRIADLPEILREGLKEDDQAAPNSRCIPDSRLLDAIRAPGKARKPIEEDIARFLEKTGGSEFSRKRFEHFLRNRGRRDMDLSCYATAGRYLRALVEKGVLKHNGGKANKSRFRVSEVYLMEG